MTIVGTIAALYRHPVKSMMGQSVDRAHLGPAGLDGDRAFALQDEETGFVVSAKRPKRWGDILRCSARTVDGATTVQLPHGETFAIDDPALAEALSTLFGRRVRVLDAPPEGASFEEVWERELKAGAGTYGGAPTQLIDGEESVHGGQFMHEHGDFQNYGKVHLIATGVLRRLREIAPGSDFDARRYRPNLLIETPDTGWVEDAWVNKELTVGGARLNIVFGVPRCVLTTLPVGDDLPLDREALRTVTEHHLVRPFEALGDPTPYPGVGVYADVIEPGEVAIGDEVRVEG